MSSAAPYRFRLAGRSWFAPRLQEWGAFLLLACMLTLSFQRLRIGVDVWDEAYYAVVTQRFVLGDRPYLDEVSVRQTAHLLMVPFYFVYLKLVGSTDGVIYFLRLWFFALQLVTALTAFRLANRLVGRAAACVAAAVPIVFMPYAMPAFSYNTVGSLLFAGGTFLVIDAITDGGPRARRTLILAGFAHGLASLAYPPFAAAVGVVGVAARWWLPPEQRLRTREATAYALAATLVGCAIVLPFAGNILAGRELAMAYENSLVSDRNVAKLLRILLALGARVPWSTNALVVAALLLPLLVRLPALRKYAAASALVATAIWFSYNHHQPLLMPVYTLSLHAVIYVGLLAGPMLLAFARGGERHVLFKCGFVPATAAGVLAAFASGHSGCFNAGLGLLPAAVLALIAMPMAFHTNHPARSSWLALCAGASVVISMQLDNHLTTFYDGPPSDGRRTVSIGPYKGLLGSLGKADEVEELTRVVRRHAKPAAPMLVYYDRPAAYLMAPSRPAFPTSWTDTRTNIAGMLPYYARKRTGAGIVVVFPRDHSVSPELERLVEVPSRLLASTAWFRVYREPPPFGPAQSD